METEVLLLLDNSLSIGGGNLAICRETIRYIADNAKEGISLGLAVYGEDMDVICDYGEDRAILKEKAGLIELTDRDACLTDVLTEELLYWRKADLADRCIILFTDGKEKAPVRHAREELYFLLNELDYPVYVVDLITKEEVSLMNLSAISTISGGGLLYSEFEGSEAGVEQKLGDELLFLINTRYSLPEQPSYVGRGETEIYRFEDNMVPEAFEGTDILLDNEEKSEAGKDSASDDMTREIREYERLSGINYSDNQISLTSRAVKSSPDYISILSGCFFLVAACIIIKLLSMRKKKRSRGSRHSRHRKESRQTELIYEENGEPTVCLSEEEADMGQTELLFSKEADTGPFQGGFYYEGLQ